MPKVTKQQREKGNYHRQNDMKRCDIFGQPVSLKLDGESAYKTRLGGGCTLLLYLILVWVGANKMRQLVVGIDPSSITTT